MVKRMLHKRFLITAVLTFGLVVLASAQQFHGGLSAGLVGSQVAGDTYSGFRKAGIFAGGYVGWDFDEHSGLQMELTYFQKGSRHNPDSTDVYSPRYLLRVNYLELPVLYMYKLNRWAFFGGPSLGFLVGYYEDYDYGLPTNDNKPAAVTFQVNLGLRFFISDHFGFDFRTNNSLLNIRQANATGDVWRLWGYGQFNDALVLSVFWQIR